MTSCEYYITLISAQLDGELTEDENRVLTEHLAVCPECRAVREAFAAVSGALCETLEEAPETLHENIMAGVRRIELKKKNTRRRAVSTVAACAAVALLGGIGLSALPRADSRAAGAVYYEAAATEETAYAREAPAVYFAAPAAPAAPAAASYSASFDSAAEAVCEEDNGAAVEYYDFSDSDCSELAALLTDSEAEFDGVYERCIDLRLIYDGTETELLLYISGDSVYCVSEDGTLYLSACDAQYVDNFVLSHK